MTICLLGAGSCLLVLAFSFLLHFHFCYHFSIHMYTNIVLVYHEEKERKCSVTTYKRDYLLSMCVYIDGFVIYLNLIWVGPNNIHLFHFLTAIVVKWSANGTDSFF